MSRFLQIFLARQVREKTTDKFSKSQADVLEEYDKDFKTRTNGKYTYYESLYKGTSKIVNLKKYFSKSLGIFHMPFRSPQNFFAQINNYFFVVDPDSVNLSFFKTALDTNDPRDQDCIKSLQDDFKNTTLSKFMIRQCCPNVARKIGWVRSKIMMLFCLNFI